MPATQSDRCAFLSFPSFGTSCYGQHWKELLNQANEGKYSIIAYRDSTNQFLDSENYIAALQGEQNLCCAKA